MRPRAYKQTLVFKSLVTAVTEESSILALFTLSCLWNVESVTRDHCLMYSCDSEDSDLQILAETAWKVVSNSLVTYVTLHSHPQCGSVMAPFKEGASSEEMGLPHIPNWGQF